MCSDNPLGDPDNQQGRLEAYLSGFADEEGTFSVTVTRRRDLTLGWQLVPEFRVSQNVERASVLFWFQEVLGCGRITQNNRNRASDRTLVLVVRNRNDLLNRVIPFFQRNPLISEKRQTFEIFTEIVKCMAAGEHRLRHGFYRLAELAHRMNGGGSYRRRAISDVIGLKNPQRLYAEHPEG